MIDTTIRSHVDLLARARFALKGLPEPHSMAARQLLAELTAAERGMAMGGLPWPITVHVGVIEHRHGANLYAAYTRAALDRDLAGFCREYWSELPGGNEAPPSDDGAAVSAYFVRHDQDGLTCEQTTLEPPSGLWASDAPIQLERGRYCVLSTAHITVSTADLISLWSTWPPNSRPLDIAASVRGWFVPTRPPEDIYAAQLPPDLAALMAFGRDGGFDHVLLDCDGDETDGLKTHDW
ncbi:MAG: hypothetical protein KGJ57_18405 [Sphingomonadales bacterium]|nr:hypothetical protein [Sphingomonadales bacterium]MDE2171372.1 hypothetical protein [Sphingomonadales bacterium]